MYVYVSFLSSKSIHVPFLSGVLSGYFLSFLEHSYVSECVCVFSSMTIPVCVCVCVIPRTFLHVYVPFLSGVLSGYFLSFPRAFICE